LQAEEKILMPYTHPKDRTENMMGAIAVLADEINLKGDLNFVICELVGQLILKSKIGYSNMSEWIDTLPDAEDELRRRLLHQYEDKKIVENGDVPAFIEILEKIR
jgi:hypothetical protein